MLRLISGNRTPFLLSALIIGILQLFSCKKDLKESVAIDELQSAKPGGNSNIVRNPLNIPSAITSSTFTLTAAPGTHDLGDATTNVWQYNGSMPGPTIIANTGDIISATYNNGIPEPSIIHWHGMLVNHQNDGQPMQVIPSGSSYSYNFPVINRAGLNWYHPHPHLTIGKQVYNGLAGAFIIRDAEEAALNLPAGKYEVPLVMRDISLDKKGDPVYSPTGGGYFGKIPLVNGTKNAYLDVDRTVYRFRVLIGTTSRVFNLALSNGASFTLIGNDGGLLPTSSNQTSIEVSPGERLDLLVDFSAIPAGTNIMLKELNSGWDLLQFRVTSTTVNYTGASTTTSYIPVLQAPVTTRFFSFDGMGKINGMAYDMNRIDFEVPFDQTELWTFKTNGNGPHPIHVHGASFQVLSRTGGRGQVFPWEAGWKDVVLVNDFETVNVLIRFNTYKGIYVMHCHKLEHEDNGMMMNFEVK
ncbi:MAG TPA: multicopper oxidase family protein [Chitinophagaceae bacterium]